MCQRENTKELIVKMLNKEEKLDRIYQKVNKDCMSKYQLAKMTGVSEAGIGKILNKTSKNPQISTVDKIYTKLFSNDLVEESAVVYTQQDKEKYDKALSGSLNELSSFKPEEILIYMFDNYDKFKNIPSFDIMAEHHLRTVGKM